MNRILHKLFDIRQDEVQKALLMFIYIFLIIASLLILKSLRDSLLLTRLGISRLPYAFLLTALFAMIIINIYSKLAKTIRFNKLILYTTFIWIGSLIIFRILLYMDYHAKWFFFAFYVWVALFGVLATSQFWLLANYVFNVREAKRLFGLVGAGGIAGGIFGGYLTRFLVYFVGTDNMIFFCIGFLFLCLLILSRVWEKTAGINYSEQMAREKRLTKTYAGESGVKLILKSRHLSLLAGIIGLGVIVATLVHYQFSAVATRMITDEDQLTAFFGFWLSNLGIASLIIQLFLTRRIMRIFGVITSLFFLPIGILIGTIGILIHPALWSAILIKVSDGGFKQSINRSGTELLILPIPSEVKNKSKIFIDVLVDSLATGIGGILLILLTGPLGFSQQHISIVVILFIIFWLYFVLRIKAEYINSFRIALEKRSIDLDEQAFNLDDASVIESLIRVLDGNNEKQILYVLQLIENIKNERFIPFFQKLIHHASPEIKIQVLKNVSQYNDVDFSKEVDLLVGEENFDVKVASLRYLCKRSQDRKSSLQKFLVHDDYKIRSAALLCTAYELNENEDFRNEINFIDVFSQFINSYEPAQSSVHESTFIKMTLARVIGTAGDFDLFPFLKNLLNDKSPEVVESAIISAGMTTDPIFIPILIQYLNTKVIRRVAREALAKYGNHILETLDKYLSNVEEDRQIRLQIPKVLALIGTRESVNLLFKHSDQNDLLLRFRVIKALSRLRDTYPLLKFNKQRIENIIIRETQKYFKTLSFLNALSHSHSIEEQLWANRKNRDRIKKIWQLLLKAIEERLSDNLEIVFILLGLDYSPTDMYNTYRAIISGNPSLRDNALEFLDNTLTTRLKRRVTAIVEHASRKNSIDYYQEIAESPIQSEKEVFQALLNEDAYWIQVCVLYLYAESGLSAPRGIIEQFTGHPDFKVREVAEYALQRLDA